MNFDVIWKNIQHYEGQVFKTVWGVEYKYTLYNDYLLINNDKKRKITKDAFKISITIENPTPSNIKSEGIWGPSYVYGIISDERIKSL